MREGDDAVEKWRGAGERKFESSPADLLPSSELSHAQYIFHESISSIVSYCPEIRRRGSLSAILPFMEDDALGAELLEKKYGDATRCVDVFSVVLL